MVPSLIYSILWDSASERVTFKQTSAARLMDNDLLLTELEKQIATAPTILRDEWSSSVVATSVTREPQKTLQTLRPEERTEKSKKDQIFEVQAFAIALGQKD